MSRQESKCPTCGKNTSGTLPFNILMMADGYYADGSHNPEWGKTFSVAYYPCDEHWQFFKSLMEYERYKIEQRDKGRKEYEDSKKVDN